MRFEELNALDAAAAVRELQRCCGSTRWAQLMADARPFASVGEMAVTSDLVWASLGPQDWLQAFAAHPRIGERTRSSWEATEQACGNDGAGVRDDVRATLEQLNRDYEARFGHIFIVCATGKTAEEIVGLLEQRLGNNPDEELPLAADEQNQITRLRLAKLMT